MYVCHDQLEQESPTVLFVPKNLEQSKISKHQMAQDTRSIVVKIAGQSEALFITHVNIVVAKLKHQKLLINSIATRFAEIKDMLESHIQKNIGRRLAMVLKVRYPKTLGSRVISTLCGIQRGLTIENVTATGTKSGDMQLLRGIDILVRYAVIRGQAVRSLTLTILSRLVYTQSYGLKLITAGCYADNATLRQILGERRNLKIAWTKHE